MARKHSTAGPAVALASVFAALAFVVGCGPVVSVVPRPVDLTALTPCQGEDGPGAIWAPCAWEASRSPEQLHPGFAWVVYAEHCPVDTVQDRTTVNCVTHNEWSNQ